MTACACRKQRILLVDDDPSVCETVALVLKLDGHLVDSVSSGSEALALFAPGKFDLVFTDYYMPAMTGDKLAAALKGRSPSQPIIMLTAYGEKLHASGSPLTCVDGLFVVGGRTVALRRFSMLSNPSPEPTAAPASAYDYRRRFAATLFHRCSVPSGCGSAPRSLTSAA